MNHLQEAKNRIVGENTVPAYEPPSEREIKEAKVHALIAIAETLGNIEECLQNMTGGDGAINVWTKSAEDK